MMKRYLLVPLLICSLFIGGCVQKKIIDKILLVQSAAYDKGEDGMVNGTLGTTVYTRSGNSKIDTYRASGKTIVEIWQEIDSRTPKPLMEGQTKAVLFGDGLAKQGVMQIADTLQRSSMIGSATYLAVVDGNAGDMLEGNYTASELPSMYISDLLEQNIHTDSLPKTNLHFFNNHLRSLGSDAILPLLKQYKDHIAIEGLALFDDDRYVGNVDSGEMFVFRRLYENTKNGYYEMPYKLDGKKGNVSIQQITSRQSYDFSHMDTIPDATIHMKINGIVIEAANTALKLRKSSTVNFLEKGLAKKVETQAEQLIRRFQKMGIDPLGIGMRMRHSDRNWNAKKWADVYPRMNIKVKANVEIVESGTKQ